MLVFPERVLHGDVPNVDFLHLYGPGSLWVLAAVYKLFGVSLWSERGVGFLQQVALVAAVFVLSRPWGRWVAAAGAMTSAVIVVPPIGLTALPWVGGVGLALWSVIASLAGRHEQNERRAERLLLLGGILGGFALLYRPDLILAVGAGLLVAGWRLPRTRRRRLLQGAAAGLSPFLVHLARAGPVAAWNGMVVDPIFRLRAGRRLPLPPSWNEFDGFLQKAGRLNAPRWPLPAPPSPAQLTLWFFLLLLAVGFLLFVGWRTHVHLRGSARARTLLAAGAVSAGVLPQALQRADSTHLAWVSCVALGFLPAVICELLDRVTFGRIVAAAAPFVLLVALVPHNTLRTYADATAQSFGYHRESYTIRNGDRFFYYGRADAAAAVNDMLLDVNRLTHRGQRLFVGTGDLRKTPYSEAFLYYLLPNLPPATYFIEMDPGVANASGSRLASDLRSADVVILSSIRDDWEEPNASRVIGSDVPNEVLRRDFCLEGSYGKGLFGHGLYELYLRCTSSG